MRYLLSWARPHMHSFLESLVCAVFLAVAVTGFRWSLWVVVFALAAHGIFDLTHAAILYNPGVPGWWAEFCLAYDVTAASVLGRVAQGRAHWWSRLISGYTAPWHGVA